MQDKFLQTLLKLPLQDRVELAGEIWNSFKDEEILTSPGVKKMLRSRLKDIKSGHIEVMTLSQFRKKVEHAKREFEKNRRRSA